jgi:hypothetical protein
LNNIFVYLYFVFVSDLPSFQRLNIAVVPLSTTTNLLICSFNQAHIYACTNMNVMAADPRYSNSVSLEVKRPFPWISCYWESTVLYSGTYTIHGMHTFKHLWTGRKYGFSNKAIYDIMCILLFVIVFFPKREITFNCLMEIQS